jgi:PPK2 family polyphosphate:nucleotide phosphotransferase
MKKETFKAFSVAANKTIALADYDPNWKPAGDLNESDREAAKARAIELLEKNKQELAAAQELLYASDVYSVLIIFQGMDAAGKDGLISHIMSGVNPQGCQVYAFKQPSAEELDHNYLWRCSKALPERGRIGIFNRSYYEDVLVVKVHPEYLTKLPYKKFNKKFWKHRYQDINTFERHLVRNGTLILKFFLNVSKAEQKARFLERLNDPKKHWKFSLADLAERGHWDEYQQAYEDVLNETSTKWAPWYVIPCDDKWAARAIVSDIIIANIAALKLKYPAVDEAAMLKLEEAKKQLEAEK